MRISDARNEYLHWRLSQGFAKNTVRNDKSAIKLLTDVVGDMHLADLDYQHMMRVFDHMSKTRANSSINQFRANLSSFFQWCRLRKYLAPDHDPLAEQRPRKVGKKRWNRIPVGDFLHFLDHAEEPRQRVMAALGLFLFLRAGEVTSLRIRDVHLDDGTIDVTVWKTKDVDTMQIPLELDRELRRWYTHYQSEVGVLEKDMYLVPARIQAGWGKHRLNPRAAISRPQEVIKPVLTAYGIDEKWEAFHCLRRSGARALFDELSDRGIDGSLEITAAMLHHASVTMTERYLGITHSRAKRDNLVRGQYLFPSLHADNVIRIDRTG